MNYKKLKSLGIKTRVYAILTYCFSILAVLSFINALIKLYNSFDILAIIKLFAISVCVIIVAGIINSIANKCVSKLEYFVLDDIMNLLDEMGIDLCTYTLHEIKFLTNVIKFNTEVGDLVQIQNIIDERLEELYQISKVYVDVKVASNLK